MFVPNLVAVQPIFFVFFFKPREEILMMKIHYCMKSMSIQIFVTTNAVNVMVDEMSIGFILWGP